MNNSDDDFRVEAGATTFGSLKSGWYPARISAVINIGTQHYRIKGRSVASRQYYIAFEIDARSPSGRPSVTPIVHAVKVTASMDDRSQLGAIAKACRVIGNGPMESFSVSDLVGKVLRLNVKRNENRFNDIASLTPFDGDSSDIKWKVEPVLRNPIRDSEVRSFQEIWEELSTDPNLPTVFGQSVASLVANSQEMNLGDSPNFSSTSNNDDGGDSNEIPF